MLEKIKKILKSNKIFRDLNSNVKGKLLDILYQVKKIQFGDYWNEYKSIDFNRVAIKLLKDRLSDIKRNNYKSKLNIFFVGTYYDHEAQGLIQGLEKFGDVYTYINANGEYGINSPRKMKLSGIEHKKWCLHLYESIFQANQIRPIDLVIGTFTAPNISLETILLIRKLSIPIFNFALDDMLTQHWKVEGRVRMGAIGLGSAVDLTLHTTPELIPRYLKRDFPAIYCPLASDPDIFAPALKKDIDVLFVGNCYGKREKLIARCIEEGINIEAYGSGFPRGHVSGEDVPGLFSRSKIILGSGLVGHSANLVTLKLRDFDAPMAGALYLTSHNALLASHFKIGDEIVTYKNLDECIQKIKYYLTNEKERQRISVNGRNRCIDQHTWYKRLQLPMSFLTIK
jgi:hypothetical protein